MKSKNFFIAVLVGLFAIGYFLIDGFTPDITEIYAEEESLTAKTGARFYVPSELTVKTLNGQSVKWKPKFTAKAVSVLLVPGSYDFILDFKTSDGNTNISAKDLKISKVFMSGEHYSFTYSLDKKENKISYSIKETNPVMNKSGYFTPQYGSLIGFILAAIAFLVLILWIKFRPKTKVLQPFDGRSTKENAATLLIRTCYTVRMYNGYEVNWSSTIASAASILLPPGKCSIVFDYSEQHGDTTQRAINHPANGNLEAGKTYIIKSIRYMHNGESIMVTRIAECKADEIKTYLSGIYSPVITKDLGSAQRVGENITKENAQQFVNDFMRKIQNEGYRFIDERSGNAAELYQEFNILDIPIKDGEVYCYKKPHWNLLISRGELGIMLSFTDTK